MWRRFFSVLDEWNNNSERKPMLVVGARQVGKTWAIQHFCEEKYKDWLYINLEKQEEYKEIFERSLEPETIIRYMEQLAGRHIDENCTIVLDEIQRSERAITSLKYFCEDKKPYRIIGAGSLLGVKINRFEASFPVGKVEIHNMTPMDFEEFMVACGEEILRDAMFESYEKRKPMLMGVHEKAMRLFEDYLYIGGMPEAVGEYIAKEKDTARVGSVFYDNIYTAYQADMTKYTISAAEGVRIGKVYQSLPKQLARENPKFKYREIGANANKRDYRTAIDWLESSGLVYRVSNVERPESPLKAYEDENAYKLYLSDVGILSHMSGISRRLIGNEEPNIYRGAVTENYVVQQMAAMGYGLHYYKPDESMEVDLFMDNGDEYGLQPIEIKSGRHRRSTSLKNYCKKYLPKRAIKLSKDNFGEAEGVLTMPLYAVGCLGRK
ncbi:MAG: ATP-binding protein [Lachnospiraceae bacterium]|nr:ATP-binding protein [Lachnospiraceae bacterium]